MLENAVEADGFVVGVFAEFAEFVFPSTGKQPQQSSKQLLAQLRLVGMSAQVPLRASAA
jgi:hypothetical protein